MRLRKPKNQVVPEKVKKQTEHELQADIVRMLQVRGYDVMVTTAYRQKGGTGVQKGIPDLLVHRDDWGPGVLVGLEVKRPGRVKWSSLEQELAWVDGQTIVVQSVLAAIAAVENRGADGAPALIASKMMTDAERNERIARLIILIELEKAKKRQDRRGLRG